MNAQAQLESFIDRYDDKVAALARQALALMARRSPGATRLVYDNYNALAIGFSATEKQSGIVFSVTLYPRWVSLFFGRGAELADPDGLLEGSGKSIRHVKLHDAEKLESPAVQALVAEAIAIADPPVPTNGDGEIVIKSVSAKQRPRRP